MRTVCFASSDKLASGNGGKAFLKGLWIITAVFLLTINVHALDLGDSLGIGELTEALPEEARSSMEGVSPDTLPDDGFLDNIRDSFTDMVSKEVKAVTKTAVLLMTVCIIVSLTDALELGSASQYVMLSGVASIGTAGMADLDSFLQMGTKTLHKAADYAKIVLPVLSGAAAAGGAVSGASARYAATALYLSILLEAADSAIMPCICGLAALSVADAAIGNNVLKSAKKLLKRTCELLLTGICLGFTAWLGIAGVVSDPSDALASRAVKTAISTALPVVGGILSDAAGTIAAAAGVLRGSVGVFGILAVTFICLGPMVSLGIRYLAYKIAGALCCSISDKRLTKLIEDLGSCFGLILALNGAGALMLFLSFYSLIRTVV